MKATGIIRKVDELGRIVVPKELRIMMNMDVGEPVEIFTDGDSVILRRYSPENACMVTGEVNSDNMRLAGGNVVLSKEGAEKLIKEMNAKEEWDGWQKS
ncbi:AbrB/MazE/SpoVT family DNA-binding domain-containing protein [Salinicoccus roseus]|uniref:AbrB/MazE/SpoVT family DNA-binding domain-containing protein n=1 Tax=Salinicoccus roseus TaxID=45670 RepID=A0A0C2HKE0_9STAP|nr:AbrB/MazE/SpoVT family DNA-binding domain-containing protein [Salinicoccus roseus]KIH70051.1 hypothetical protein SN16_11150 [Salinicoccus roseus]MDB0581359.1 AbrB/MazE/SpoVT family DNA-binding domain-containing protein [Salinicoccus roseus]